MTNNSSNTVINPGEGYKRLIIWKNAERLRSLVWQITRRFGAIEFRRVTQMTDAARSVKQNIQEGYKCDSAGSFVRYLKVSTGSLGELKGDIDDCFQDKIISEIEFRELDKLCGTTDCLLQRMIKSINLSVKSGRWKNYKS